MTQIGKPEKEWEIPAPIDVPGPKEVPVEVPEEKPVEVPELTPA